MVPHQSDRVIVFADVCKSTHLFEVLGDVHARGIVSRALSILMDLITEHRGVVIKTIGDEVMSTFTDPTDAIQATSNMHSAVRNEPSLAEVGLAIKVGMHFGSVLLEDNDVYGDAVNVAARMVGLAKADQIIATRITFDHLPSYLRPYTRRLGPVEVRGKQDAIDIVEYLWDTSDLTVMRGTPLARKPDVQTSLILRYGEQDIILRPNHPSFSIGRGRKNDLVVETKEASRTHVYIEFRKDHFVLVDHSTNGTYLQIGTAETIFLHRDHIRLRGTGSIRLGRETSGRPEDGIYYQYVH